MSSIDSSQGPAVTVADRYALRELIAVGGMGEVYSGWDTKLDRPVAVKLLRRAMADLQDCRARFESEARAGGRLTHPGIVAVFDTGEHEGLPFMVMERLTGRTLADGLRESGAMQPDRAADAAVQVLRALHAAHREGILHRDLKPANILLSSDGAFKVADFGVAKVAGSGDLTQTGTMVGTAAYLAPERVEGKPATEASDLYAVGAILFEMLGGFKPFQADTPLALMRAIGHDDPPDLLEVRPELDRGLVAIVNRAMDKDPARRFPSAGAMAAALEQTLDAAALKADPSAEKTLALSGGLDHPAREPDQHRTQVLPGRRRGSRLPEGPELYRLAGLAAVVLAVIVVVMLISRNSQIEPADADISPDVTSGEGLPPGLDDALRDLEEAVRE